MKSFVLAVSVVLSLLLCVPLASAASISSIGFYSDAACTAAINASALSLATTSYTQWTSLPYNGVYDLESPPCFNDAIPGVSSGTYECLSNYSSLVGGLLVAEYSQPNCNGTLLQLFEFLGPANATCFSGFVEIPAVAGPPTMTFMYARVICSNSTGAPSPGNAAAAGALLSTTTVLLIALITLITLLAL
jgi:hypothetical protein